MSPSATRSRQARDATTSDPPSQARAAQPTTGAEAVVLASAAAGIQVCFANAGTSEMALVSALDRHHSIRPVPVLFEGVASGAADGYARIAGKPASVMLHLGPGLANAAANLHNARRAQSPVVVWVGDHARWLLPHDPPLASDIEAIARGSARWIHTSSEASELASDAHQAVMEAKRPVPGVATLVLPMDLLDVPVQGDLRPPAAEPSSVDTVAIEAVADELRGAERPLLLLGGHATDESGLLLAQRIAHACSGRLMVEQFPRCQRRAPHLPSPDRLGYLPFVARSQLEQHDLIVALGASPPVCFFGYRGQAPRLTPDGCKVLEPAANSHVGAVMNALCLALDAGADVHGETLSPSPAPTTGRLQPDAICRVIASRLPDDSVVVCEGITSSLPLYASLAGAAAHDLLTCKGGAIGFGTPAATGAAIAAPDRRVIAYVGDGSALYTIQSLWTQAREGLDVTTIVLVNRKYAVLQMELLRSGGAIEGAGDTLTDIDNIDFVQIARGFGVPATEARDVPAFITALERSFATPGPSLIAAMI